MTPADLLAAPRGPDWTIETLAEAVLAAAGRNGFTLDAADLSDRQARRLLRPLLACLAVKSAAESGTDADPYGGDLAFDRPGPVRITGRFDNRPGRVRVSLSPTGVDRTSVAGRSGSVESVRVPC